MLSLRSSSGFLDELRLAATRRYTIDIYSVLRAGVAYPFLFYNILAAQKMIIKQPCCFDISHWKEILDFKLVDPRPTLFITKATEGTSIVDAKFPRFFAGMREIGVHRGVYHFNRKALDAVRQAQHFCNTIRPVVSSDILILDMEEGGEKAPQLWAWFEYVKRAFPNNLLMIYSTAGLLNAIAMTAAEKEYFRQIPTWAAGYPWFPDLFSSVPGGYIPDQSKWGPVYLWQYSEHGKVTGIQGDVDLNWISASLISLLDDAVILPPITPIGGTMKGTVTKLVTSSLNVRSATTGQVVAALKYDFTLGRGDAVYGEVKADNRIYFTKIYRANGNTQALTELCSAITKEGSTIWMLLSDEPEPGTPPSPVDFRWPDRLEAQYTDAAGNTVANKFYIPE